MLARASPQQQLTQLLRWVGGYCGLGTCGANNSVGDRQSREARTSKTITLEVAESIENVTAKMAN